LHHLSGGDLISSHVFENIEAQRAGIWRDIVRRFLRIDNQMRELLVVDFDGANGFAHGRFINRRDGYDLVSSPMDLVCRLLLEKKNLYARHPFDFPRIDIRDARVGIWRSTEGAV